MKTNTYKKGIVVFLAILCVCTGSGLFYYHDRPQSADYSLYGYDRLAGFYLGEIVETMATSGRSQLFDAIIPASIIPIQEVVLTPANASEYFYRVYDNMLAQKIEKPQANTTIEGYLEFKLSDRTPISDAVHKNLIRKRMEDRNEEYGALVDTDFSGKTHINADEYYSIARLLAARDEANEQKQACLAYGIEKYETTEDPSTRTLYMRGIIELSDLDAMEYVLYSEGVEPWHKNLCVENNAPIIIRQLYTNPTEETIALAKKMIEIYGLYNVGEDIQRALDQILIKGE